MASGNGKPKPSGREVDQVRMGWHPIRLHWLEAGQADNSAEVKSQLAVDRTYSPQPRSEAASNNPALPCEIVGGAMSGARGRIIRRRTSGSSRFQKRMARPVRKGWNGAFRRLDNGKQRSCRQRRSRFAGPFLFGVRQGPEPRLIWIAKMDFWRAFGSCNTVV
jgi:hypothetical protein